MRFLLQRLWHSKPYKHPLVLIDETDLQAGVKAIVAAVALRNRAIPIFWWVYRNTELRDTTYKSHKLMLPPPEKPKRNLGYIFRLIGWRV